MSKRTSSPTYKSWSSARDRCYCVSATGYDRYGGSGITMCERWNSFENFLADMGERPDGTTLDRYPDPNGNYEPNNCRWATKDQQNNNRGRYNRTLTISGQILTVAQAAAMFGLSYTTIVGRLEDGWTDSAAVLPARVKRT